MDISFGDSIDNEWVHLFIMKKMRQPVSKASIGSFGDQKVLIVDRFDRRWRKYKGIEILLHEPQEDMCQILSLSPFK